MSGAATTDILFDLAVIFVHVLDLAGLVSLDRHPYAIRLAYLGKPIFVELSYKTAKVGMAKGLRSAGKEPNQSPLSFTRCRSRNQ